MKKVIFSIATSLFFCGCTAKSELKAATSADSLVGDWMYYRYNGQHAHTNQIFSLTLRKVSQTSVVGNYCSTWDSGSRIDCSAEETDNIKGFFNKDTLSLSFYGFYDSRARGKAKVYKREDGAVIWELGKCEGTFYLPEKVVLLRNDTAKFNSDIKAIDAMEKKPVVIEKDQDAYADEISLPFDFHQFQEEKDQYDQGELEDFPYHSVSIEGNKYLEQTYKSLWDKSRPSLLYRIHTERKFQLDMVCYYIEDTPSLTYRLITSVDGTVIDGLTVFSQAGEDIDDWNISSFTISEGLDIVIYKNRLYRSKIVKQSVIARYIIDGNGKFIRKQT